MNWSIWSDLQGSMLVYRFLTRFCGSSAAVCECALLNLFSSFEWRTNTKYLFLILVKWTNYFELKKINPTEKLEYNEQFLQTVTCIRSIARKPEPSLPSQSNSNGWTLLSSFITTSIVTDAKFFALKIIILKQGVEYINGNVH